MFPLQSVVDRVKINVDNPDEIPLSSGLNDNAKGSRAPRHLRARLLIEGGYECVYTSHDQKISSKQVLLAKFASLGVAWGYFICGRMAAIF